MKKLSEHITLKVYLSPKNFREFEISGNASLYKLAELINVFYGFLFDHPFGFYSDLEDYYESKECYELFADMGEPIGDNAKSVKKSTVANVFNVDGKTFLFLFDYGDEWTFKVERISAVIGDAPPQYSRLIRSVGKNPKQYG
jgi:hypothetical protein